MQLAITESNAEAQRVQEENRGALKTISSEHAEAVDTLERTHSEELRVRRSEAAAAALKHDNAEALQRATHKRELQAHESSAEAALLLVHQSTAEEVAAAEVLLAEAYQVRLRRRPSRATV
jgi:hypothetical protein